LPNSLDDDLANRAADALRDRLYEILRQTGRQVWVGGHPLA
jgi:hypothetical protein